MFMRAFALILLNVDDVARQKQGQKLLNRLNEEKQTFENHLSVNHVLLVIFYREDMRIMKLISNFDSGNHHKIPILNTMINIQ